MVYQNPEWMRKGLENKSRFGKIIEAFYRKIGGDTSHPLYANTEFDKDEHLTKIQFYDKEEYSLGLQVHEGRRGNHSMRNGAFWVTTDTRTPREVLADLTACLKSYGSRGYNVNLEARM